MDMAAPRHIKTTCPYCGVGCGVIAEVSGTGDVSVRGDESHPSSALPASERREHRLGFGARSRRR
jgi:anaerobic selenocysteine-containing dehydrogenase